MSRPSDNQPPKYAFWLPCINLFIPYSELIERMTAQPKTVGKTDKA